MKLCTIILMQLLAGTIAVFGQAEISGTVKDQLTGDPLPFANVFFNNTTIGTTTDTSGVFLLKSIPEGPADLVVSYVGYQTWQQRLKSTQAGKLDIRLVPLTRELVEVEIHDKRDKEWEKKFKKFEREFLGETFNGKRSKIVNPWVVNFEEHDKVIRASADQPVEIDNLGLGYKVFFYIKTFETGPGVFTLVGNVRFAELEPPTEGERQRWERGREEAYLGSERHFFWSILQNKVEAEGFSLYMEPSSNPDLVRSALFSEELREKRLIPLSLGTIGTSRSGKDYKIRIPGRIEIHYKYLNGPSFYRDIPYPVSWIEPVVPLVTVTASGILHNPLDVRMSGYFITRRTADMLPANYQPE